MEKIEIYSSRKKSFFLLIASVLFVVGGIYMFVYADNTPNLRYRSPIFIKGVGIALIIFFSFGIYVSIKQLLKKELILIIDKVGLNLNPKKITAETIAWKNINGFSEIKIHNQKIVVIEVNNPDHWIEKEENKMRKSIIKFNLNNYGSPFNLSANPMQINHRELLKTLNENLVKNTRAVL